MATTVIEEKLESLRRCLARIRLKRPDSAEALKADLDSQDIISVNLTRAVQLCVDIAAHLLTATDQPPPDTMGDSFDRMVSAGLISQALAGRMKAAVGFRNIAVHSYRQIDWDIVHAIVNNHLEDFEAFASQVLVSSNSKNNS
ncbi:MAG: DUF86 domain-containing protein [Wenzhouxiangella sp.]|nr:MAG: DUF86 domain-containing protein [Wenzhouxiangella sp.]